MWLIDAHAQVAIKTHSRGAFVEAHSASLSITRTESINDLLRCEWFEESALLAFERITSGIQYSHFLHTSTDGFIEHMSQGAMIKGGSYVARAETLASIPGCKCFELCTDSTLHGIAGIHNARLKIIIVDMLIQTAQVVGGTIGLTSTISTRSIPSRKGR